MIYGFEYNNITIDFTVNFLSVSNCAQTRINACSVQNKEYYVLDPPIVFSHPEFTEILGNCGVI